MWDDEQFPGRSDPPLRIQIRIRIRKGGVGGNPPLTNSDQDFTCLSSPSHGLTISDPFYCESKDGHRQLPIGKICYHCPGHTRAFYVLEAGVLVSISVRVPSDLAVCGQVCFASASVSDECLDAIAVCLAGHTWLGRKAQKLGPVPSRTGQGSDLRSSLLSHAALLPVPLHS